MYKTLEGHPWTPLVIMVPGYKKKKKFFLSVKFLTSEKSRPLFSCLHLTIELELWKCLLLCENILETVGGNVRSQ